MCFIIFVHFEKKSNIILNSANKTEGLGYQANYNPSQRDLGFSKGQFNMFDSNRRKGNSSSIFVPYKVISQSKGKTL